MILNYYRTKTLLSYSTLFGCWISKTPFHKTWIQNIHYSHTVYGCWTSVSKVVDGVFLFKTKITVWHYNQFHTLETDNTELVLETSLNWTTSIQRTNTNTKLARKTSLSHRTFCILEVSLLRGAIAIHPCISLL